MLRLSWSGLARCAGLFAGIGRGVGPDGAALFVLVVVFRTVGMAVVLVAFVVVFVVLRLGRGIGDGLGQFLALGRFVLWNARLSRQAGRPLLERKLKVAAKHL